MHKYLPHNLFGGKVTKNIVNLYRLPQIFLHHRPERDPLPLNHGGSL